jgi:hypothetical protein
MHELKANPIINNKFWIVEKEGEHFATLRKNENNKFVLSNASLFEIYANKDSLTKKYGKDFFSLNTKKKKEDNSFKEVHGYPTSVVPHNALFDVRRKLPLFTKSSDSKSLYCAGYYIIKFDKGWVKSFCPKLITVQRYPYQGPFVSEIEMRQVLTSVSK